MQLSVIIVNFNVCYFLELCLHTVQAAITDLEAEIIVVDNASVDVSKTRLPATFPTVKFIWNTENLGFSRANNIGVAAAAGEYILLLNPDTLVPETAITKCLEFLQTKPDAGAVGIRMYDGRFRFLPESKRGFPDLQTAFYKLSGLIHLFPRHPSIGRYYLGHLQEDEICQVDILAGAFILLKRSTYQQIGGFDERYFMYGEDIDLSYSIQRAGFKNYYLPNPGIIHFKGESTTRTAVNARHFYEAMLLFREKYGKKSGWPGRWLIEMAIGIRSLRERLRGWQSKNTKVSLLKKQFNICRSLDNYQPDQPQIFVLGGNFGLEELFQLLKRNPPQKSIRFSWKDNGMAIGSDDPDEKGEIIPE